MIFSFRNILKIFILTLLFAGFSSPSMAFYSSESADSSIDLRGLVRLFGTTYRNQNNDLFFPERSQSGLAGLIRFMGEAQINRSLSLELNMYQTYIPSEFISSQPNMGISLDVERSSSLEWSLSDDKYAHLAIDRLSLRWSKEWLDIIVGRQPINLATTFFFSPNDFFAPFAAQAFYRLYKPGVDALRAEIQLGDLSQLSIISVLGYDKDPASDTGWSKSPAADRNSYLFRISTVYGNFEWGLLAGSVKNNNTVGASLQGEIFSHIGLRAEGNLSHSNIAGKNHILEFSVGIDRHFENSLDFRLEHFYNGRGTSDPSKYIDLITAPGTTGISYLGRNYTAASLGYEFTPLLRGDMSLIANLDDHSMLCSLYAVYSLSNETDLSINMGIPFGKSPEGMKIESEFGLSPYLLNIEIRYFF